MKFELESSFDSYFHQADESTKEILNSDDEMITAIRTYHSFFVNELFVDKNKLKPFTALMALHSFMLFMSGIRLSLSGHEAAIFPIFRTSLEAACYAYLIGDHPKNEAAWLNRHSNVDTLKACRRKFTSAVKDTARKVQALDFVSTGTREWIEQSYDSAIDFGAHPNPKSLFSHLNIDDDREDGYVGVSLIGLHAVGSHAHNRSMMTCLDYGLIIALILICCVKPKSEELILGLQRLNELKEKLTVEIFHIEPLKSNDK